MATERLNIGQANIDWALRRAGLCRNTYVEKNPEHAKWIMGEVGPTPKQLEDFTKHVHVPFGYMFLTDLPKEKMPIPMFRKNVDKDTFNLNLYDTITILQSRQDWLSEYLVENGMDTCHCVGEVSLMTPIKETVSKMYQILNLERGWNMGCRNEDEAVRTMAEHLEEVGIMVSFNGVVGNSTNRPLSVNDCRGFALVNDVAPFIFINNSDAKRAQLFTLAHEFCHVLMGVSAGSAENISDIYEDSIERYCDNVAAAFLVDEELLRLNWTDVREMARKFRVSEIMMARRAHNLGLISREDLNGWFTLYSNYKADPKKKSSGGNYYAMALVRIGKVFAVHVRNAVLENQLSCTDAFRLVNAHGKTYDKLMEKI